MPGRGASPHKLTGIPNASLEELYRAGGDADATPLADGRFWINPPCQWVELEHAVDRVLAEVPSASVIVGPSGDFPWARRLRAAGWRELRLQQDPTIPGYFLHTQPNGSSRALPYPTWSVSVFAGTAAESLLSRTSEDLQRATVMAVTPGPTGELGAGDTAGLAPQPRWRYATVDPSSCLTVDQRAEVDGLLAKFGHVSETGPPYPRLAEPHMEIDTGGARPVAVAPRRLSAAQRANHDRALAEMLHLGVIEPSKSPWASRLLSVLKPDGSFRDCVDYRALNAVTVANVYPIPQIVDLLEAAAGSMFLSAADAWKGFWQVPLSDQAKPKTAFTT